MAVELPVHQGLPADLNNLRTLVAQNRGYHFFIPYGYPSTSGIEFHNPVMEPYYTGLTVRVFVWIGEPTAWFHFYLYTGRYRYQVYYTSIRVEGTEVKVYYKSRGQRETPYPSSYTVTAPGYFTLALRLEFPSHILAIFGENHVIHRSDHTPFHLDDWSTFWSSNGLIKLLSMHVSDELGKGSSKVILQPERRHLDFNFGYPRGDFVVIEGRVVDTSQDIVLRFAQGPGIPVQATFPPTDLEQDEEVVIFVRNTREGWLVETSFSPDSQLIRKPSLEERTYPLVSDNCEIHRMRWVSTTSVVTKCLLPRRQNQTER